MGKKQVSVLLKKRTEKQKTYWLSWPIIENRLDNNIEFIKVLGLTCINNW